MVSKIDIYRTAQLLIKEHGSSGARTFADNRMNELIDQDDVKGASVWLGVGQAIKDLLATESKERLN